MNNLQHPTFESDDAIALTGNLRLVSLSDIVQIFANGGQAGVVVLETESARGSIWFDAGRIERAELGARAGEQAFYAAAALTEGRFTVRLGRRCLSPNLDAGCCPLLLEGARRIDESNRIRAALDTDRNLLVRSRIAQDDDVAIAHLFDAPCEVDRALDRCAIGELEALTIIARLVQSGVLEPLPRAALQPAPQSAEWNASFDAWVGGHVPRASAMHASATHA